MVLLRKIVYIFTCVLLLCACEDALFDTDGADTSDASRILLSGEDGRFTLPLSAGQIASAEVVDGDFVTELGQGVYYIEQNDGWEARDFQIAVQQTDGATDTFAYRQTPVTRSAATSMKQFYRNHGVGYSYNAVTGEYCNIKNFCCQILNRAVLDQMSEKYQEDFLNVDSTLTVSYSKQYYTSVEDYVQNTYFDLRAEAGLCMLFGASVEGEVSVFEKAAVESYLLKYAVQQNYGIYTLNYTDLILYAKENPKVLTSSFRYAYSHLKTDKDIDDFLNTYGTHVVVQSWLGAKMSLCLQIERQLFNDTLYKALSADAELKGLLSYRKSTEEVTTKSTLRENSTCNLTAQGGDLSILDRFLHITQYSDFQSACTEQDVVADWMTSIKFDGTGTGESNVEMVDMDVVPLWEFIPDDSVAARIQARISGDIADVMWSFSDDNFINVSFPAQPDAVTCRLGVWQKQTFHDPDVVYYIYGGRYVAMVCHEWVPEISTWQKVYVAYPIYDGYVKLGSGLCAWNRHVYSVAWSTDHFAVIDKGDYDGETSRFYMNCGMLSFQGDANIQYGTPHAVVGCELPGSIDVNGQLSGGVNLVHKYFGHFYLDTKERYTNIPNWEYTTQFPSEAFYAQYVPYFADSTYVNRMVRSDYYYYIYNPTEVDYE
jgi:hypothetical protein